jgi:hypothetical protein
LSNNGVLDPTPSDTNVDPKTWRLVNISATNIWTDGTVDTWNIQTLQSIGWLQSNGVDAGDTISLDRVVDLKEMGAPEGSVGTVDLIGAVPMVEGGNGRVVTTTVNHLNSFVFNLTVRDCDGDVNTLGVTGYHKFYDEADGWQQVAELQLGDVLRTQAGQVEVIDITRLEGTHRVYNMTVEADHVYYVGDLTTLTHNTCPPNLYDVGTYNQLRYNAMDGTIVHHTPSRKAGFDLIADYGPDRMAGREIGIRLPSWEADAVDVAATLRNQIPASARQELAWQIRDLRNHTNAPNSALQRVIDLNRNARPWDFGVR